MFKELNSKYLSLLKKRNLIDLARKEGEIKAKGDVNKAGVEIEKYLSVFRELLTETNPRYSDLSIGYDWCCAYVYFLLKQIKYPLSPTPLDGNLKKHLGSVRTWYDWALQETRWINHFSNAEPGDLVLFNHLIENVDFDHIGIVLEVRSNDLITSEGNFNNCSGIFTRKKDQTIAGCIRL